MSSPLRGAKHKIVVSLLVCLPTDGWQYHRLSPPVMIILLLLLLRHPPASRVLPRGPLMGTWASWGRTTLHTLALDKYPHY
eukprot:2270849-Pyramimonas_sp.AAC.1